MATGSMRLPTDAAVTGPYVATDTFTEDSVTKHTFRGLVQSPAIRNGHYAEASELVTITTAADAANAGRFWLINPVGSSWTVDLRKVFVRVTSTTSGTRALSPRVTMERVTFTGTASVPLTPSKARSDDGANTGLGLDASTGLTLTAGAAICAFFPNFNFSSGVRHAHTVSVFVIRFSDEDGPILEPGEGLVFRQADAGEATRGGP